VFRVPRSAFRVSRFVFRVPRPTFRVPRSAFRVPCSVFRVSCSRFQVPGSAFRVLYSVFIKFDQPAKPFFVFSYPPSGVRGTFFHSFFSYPPLGARGSFFLSFLIPLQGLGVISSRTSQHIYKKPRSRTSRSCNKIQLTKLCSLNYLLN